MVGAHVLPPLRGFLLDSGGFITIHFPGATETAARGISPGGDIVGIYRGADGRTHGYLLSGGTFTTIDFPGAIFTQPVDINPQGDIVGNYQDAAGVFHMFLLSRGAFSSIDFPGALSTGASTADVGIEE